MKKYRKNIPNARVTNLTARVFVSANLLVTLLIGTSQLGKETFISRVLGTAKLVKVMLCIYQFFFFQNLIEFLCVCKKEGRLYIRQDESEQKGAD